MKNDVNNPVVRAKEAPRTAVSSRRIDPFFVVLGLAVILVGFFVGRGMGATNNAVPVIAGVTQNGSVHASSTYQPSAPPQTQAGDSQAQGHGVPANGPGSGDGLGNRVVPVDSSYVSTVAQVIAKNEAVGGDPSPSATSGQASGHQLVELTAPSVSSTVGAATDALTQSLQSERARLIGAESQLDNGSSDPTPSPSPASSSSSSVGAAAAAIGGSVPGEMPGGFNSPAPYEIPGGSWIPVQLDPAVDSDLSGDIRAHVVGDQCDPRTGAVVIPDGSWLQSKYAGLGAARHLDFTWYRLTQPDLTYRDLSFMKTQDEEGHSGLSGKINYQRWAFFRDTLVGSIANASGQIIAGAVSHAANVSVGNTVTGSAFTPTEPAPSLQDGASTPFLLYLQANYTVSSPYHGEFCR